MAEALFTVLALIAFVVFFAMNAHGKARVFRRGERPEGRRPPEAVTTVSLPTPRFHRRDPDQRRGKS